jgi:hypothetical protein
LAGVLPLSGIAIPLSVPLSNVQFPGWCRRYLVWPK